MIVASIAHRFKRWLGRTESDRDSFQSVAQLQESEATVLLDTENQSNPKNYQELLTGKKSGSKIQFPPHVLAAARELKEITAEGILDLRFTLHAEAEVHFDQEIDWQFDPTSDPARRWATALNRHLWLVCVAEAYQETKEERYAVVAGEIFLDWIAKNPPPATRNEQNVAWTLMGVGMRAMIWPDALQIFSSSERFRETVAPRMLLSMHDHAEFLASYQTHLNHLLRECNGLLHIGLRYPEFVQSVNWRTVAAERLVREIDYQIQGDGSHIELSPAYQWLVVEELESTLRLCDQGRVFPELNNLRVKVVKGIGDLYGYLGGIVTPAGTWPKIKEGFYPTQDQLRREMLNAARREDDHHLEWVATNGASGTPPKETKKFFPDACCAVFRDEWSPKANYLIFQNGAFGGPHGHEDALSVELWAGGTQFLLDPGTSSYNAKDPYRHYFTSSNAHSTVVVDGMSQVRRWSLEEWWKKPRQTDNSPFSAGDDLSWVAGIYSGRYAIYNSMRGNFRRAKKRITHRRQVLFIRNSYWLLVDDMAAPKPMVYERLFQCAQGMRVLDAHQGVQIVTEESEQSLYVVTREKLDINVAEGETSPIAGWVCDGSRNARYAAPQLSFRHHRCKKARLITLLMPATQSAPEPRIAKGVDDASSESIEITYHKNGQSFCDLVKLGAGDEPPELSSK